MEKEKGCGECIASYHCRNAWSENACPPIDMAFVRASIYNRDMLLALPAQWTKDHLVEYMCPKCKCWLDKMDFNDEVTGRCLNCGQGIYCPSGCWTNIASGKPYKNEAIA